MKTPVIQNEPEPSASQPAATPPDEPRKSTNLAGRMGRWSAQHRKTAIFGWLAFVVLSVAIGGAVGTKQLTDAEAVSGESGRAEQALERSQLNPNEEVVLVQSKTLTATDPVFEAAVGEATHRLVDVAAVRKVSSPADGGGQVSADGHTALLAGTAAAGPNGMVAAAAELKPEVRDAVAAGVEANLTGAAGMWSGFNEANREAMLKSELISWPDLPALTNGCCGPKQVSFAF